MYGKTTRHIGSLVMLLLLICATACTPHSPLTAKTPLTVLGALEASGMPDASEAHVIISRGKHSIEEKVPVTNNSFTAAFEVPVGEWTVIVLLVDDEGMVLFQSKPQKTQITLAGPQFMELVLRPADSKVHVTINVDNYVFKHEAMRARIHFNDEIYEVTRSDSTTPLKKTIELTPGSYEFKVELYTESFRVGDRLGSGIWEVLHVSEKEELFIEWSPVTEALHITGRVEVLLPGPENVELTDMPHGVLLSWDPIPHDEVTGYFVLAQTSRLNRFQLLNTIATEEPSFLHVFESDAPSEITYIVAAISTGGLVGYYSDPQTWSP